MVKNAIKVYARLRPEKNRKVAVNYTVHHRPKENLEEDFLILVSPTQKMKDCPDNRPESWNYSFFRVFEESTTQEDVFENVARPVMESALDGYNGTIFAYGQTASGKTHSIIGNHGNSDDRGIIPRSLQYLFNVIQKRPENLYTIEVAFLEIYNENGYDLLDRRQREYTVTRLEDLPRVTIQEDENGQLHLKNLSFHSVGSLEDAFQLLLVGDSNRVTTETPMNPQSSRSHCIFTIVVSMKEFGADHYKRAKVHLVDLAGSERVYKCSITGTILTEAKHINLSLHYLEQVIVCLGQESASHIPYRNSYLTSILRDSLGGNCMTAMLANLSAVSSNIEETISTCRFAQRVALIKNDVKLVLQTNVQSENALLKLENEKLKQQIRAMTKQICSEELTADEKWKLDGEIRNFLDSNIKISWDYNEKSIEYCFDSFRRIFELSRDPNSCLKKLEYYRDLVFQRDKEICILIIALLIDLLNKEKGRKQNCLKEGSPGDGNLPLTDKTRTVNNYTEEFKLNPEINDSDRRSGTQFGDGTDNRNRPTTENRVTNVENIKINVDSLTTVTSGPEDKINSSNRRNHKNRLKDCKATLQNHVNSRHTVINESESNCNKDGVSDRPNFLANNITNVISRKNSLEQSLTNKHISVNNSQPELFRCNVINVTLDNSSENKNKSINEEEMQQPVRKSEKKQTKNSEIKKPMTKNDRPKYNLLSGVIINEESDGGHGSKNIKEPVDESDQSVSFYEKMLRFNVPPSEMKSLLTSELSRIEPVHSNNIAKNQIHKLNSHTQNYDLQFRNTSHADRDVSKFTDVDDLIHKHRWDVSNFDAENFDTGENELQTPKPENETGNYSVSSRSSRSYSQNDDQRVISNSVSSQRLKEPLEVASTRNEQRDTLAQPMRSNVYFSNREMDSNRSERTDRKSGVCNFMPDGKEKLSARSKTKVDLHQKSDCNSNNGSFEDSLPLTGDPEIDEEIIAFYKAKRLGGVY